jgi:tetrahydromethanopterin S-methyltransferase subunit D
MTVEQMTMNQQKVNQAIEAICQTGCTSVNAVIATLEAGKTTEGLEDLSYAERDLLVRELKAIMAVYEERY